MSQPPQTTVRRLGPGDEDVVRKLAEREPQTELLHDDRTIFLAAFRDGEPIGFVFGYELPRRHGGRTILFVYELGVDAAFRRQSIATRLMTELERIARARGIGESFVLTEPDNEPANALYRALGGVRSEVVMWDYAIERRVSFRQATYDDVDLLAGWHADPEVSRYWDDERPTADEIRARLRRPTVDHWIVLEGDEPVGFLQSWWEVDGARRGGLDGFLIPSARGRGVMPRAARALAQSLLDSGWEYVTVDPYESNERAVRGWANAGFVEVSRGHPPDEDHTAPWVLMRFEPGSQFEPGS